MFGIPFDIVFGGITGLIGTVWGGYNNRKLKELDIKANESEHQYKLAEIKAETDAMIAEANASIQISESMTAGAVELAEVKAFDTSQKYGNWQSLPKSFAEKLADVDGWASYITTPIMAILGFLLGMADVIKGVARPVITAYLLAVSTWITYKAWNLLEITNASSALTSSQAIVIVEQSVSVLFYLSSAAVTWWFGDRMTEKGYSKLIKKI